MSDKPLMTAAFELLRERKTDLVDAYLIALSKSHGIRSIYSYDKEFEKYKIGLLPVQ